MVEAERDSSFITELSDYFPKKIEQNFGLVHKKR